MGELQVRIRRWLRRRFAPFPYEPYCDRLGCIFIHIPKCAGSSVHAVLSPSLRVPRWHANYRLYRTSDKRRFESYFKFTVVRNPWDRVYSGYEYLRSGGNRRSGDRPLAERIQRECADFREFVLDWLSQDALHGVLLLRPQFTFIYDLPRERLMVDDLCRFENLGDDLARVFGRLGIEAGVPHVNASPTDDFRKAYVDPRMVDRIGELYARDARLLDYDFEGRLRPPT